MTHLVAHHAYALQSKAPLSLLRLHLHTGLKHQLRVHLAQHLLSKCARYPCQRLHNGSLRPSAPILGDGLYMDPKSRVLRDIKNRIPIPWGLFLHSSRFSLHVRHPRAHRPCLPFLTRIPAEVQSVQVPPDRRRTFAVSVRRPVREGEYTTRTRRHPRRRLGRRQEGPRFRDRLA